MTILQECSSLNLLDITDHDRIWLKRAVSEEEEDASTFEQEHTSYTDEPATSGIPDALSALNEENAHGTDSATPRSDHE